MHPSPFNAATIANCKGCSALVCMARRGRGQSFCELAKQESSSLCTYTAGLGVVCEVRRDKKGKKTITTRKRRTSLLTLRVTVNAASARERQTSQAR